MDRWGLSIRVGCPYVDARGNGGRYFFSGGPFGADGMDSVNTVGCDLMALWVPAAKQVVGWFGDCVARGAFCCCEGVYPAECFPDREPFINVFE